MNTKPKVEVIELNLGVDPSELLQTPSVSQQSQERIAYLMELSAKEMEGINKIKQKEQEEALRKDEGTDRLYRRLVELAAEQTGLTTPELMQIAGSDDHVGTMVRLHNYIKKRGGLWEIVKSKAGGRTTYRVRPKLPKETAAS